MRSIFWSTCLLLLISWCSLNAPALRAIAPTHFNRHYDIQNGLPSNTTYSVIQDAQGYIWVGTDAGVCRFDGQQFVTFTVQDGLTDNEVLQLHEDSRGRIWILTYNGIPCYYYEGKFYNPENTPSLQHAVPPRHFKAFCETADGSVYLGGSRGFLARIYPDGKVETTVEKKIGHLCGLWENNNEVMAGGTPLFVHNFTRNTGEKLPFAKERTGHSRWLQKNGRMLVGLQHRFYCLNRQNEVLHQLDLPEGEVIQTVSHGPFPDQVAIGTSHGLRYWTFGTNEVSAPVLQGLSLAATCSDHENGYWVATINQGLFYAPSPGMRHFTSEHLPHVPVSSLVSWQNQVWFGAAYGLMGHLRGDALHVVPNRLEPQPGQISQMLPHNGGLLLLANKILFWYGPDGKLKPLHANNFTINTILKTEDGQLWVANRMGIVKWKEDYDWQDTKAVDQLYHHYLRTPSPIHTVLPLAGKVFLCGTNKGIYQVNMATKERTLVLKETAQKSITDLVQIAPGRVLVATAGWGAYVYHNGKLLAHIDQSQGDFPNHINKVREAPEGGLWMASNTGVYSVSNPSDPPEDWNWKHLNAGSGLLADLVSDVAFDQELIYIAGAGGISVVDTTLLLPNRAPPVLADLKVIPSQPTQEQPSMGLTFEIATISLTESNLHYRYSIDGGPWVDASRPLIHLADLSSGEHRIAATVRSNISGWSDPLEIEFKVPAKGWAIYSWGALLVLLTVGVAGFFFRKYLPISKMAAAPESKPDGRPKGKGVPQSATANLLTLKINQETVKIPKEEILWIKAEANYCAIITTQKKHLALLPLKTLERELQSDPQFLRLHRSYLVNLSKVSAAGKSEVTIEQTVIPVGATYKVAYHTFLTSFSQTEA